MPRSIQTRILNANAHALGDEYYRKLSVSSRAGYPDSSCRELALSYKMALEDLQAHLATLPNEPEVALLAEATERYIALVNLDLEAFDKSDLAGLK